MTCKLDESAFEYYVALGAQRSYATVAQRYGVSKRAVTKAARRQHWKQRLEKIERDAQERIDQRLAETIEEQHLRHTKMLRAMASRAVKAIQDFPLNNGMEGIRAAELVIKLERLAAGDPSERTELKVEEVTRQEMRRLLVREEDADAG